MMGFAFYMTYQSRINYSTEVKQNMITIQNTVMNAAGSEDSVIKSELMETN
jgi:hypothetical protein